MASCDGQRKWARHQIGQTLKPGVTITRAKAFCIFPIVSMERQLSSSPDVTPFSAHSVIQFHNAPSPS